eukprot:6203702-Pleurochrysis_carterae.AAC.1
MAFNARVPAMQRVREPRILINGAPCAPRGVLCEKSWVPQGSGHQAIVAHNLAPALPKFGSERKPCSPPGPN